MSDYFDPIPTTIAAGTRALASQVNAVANSISAGFDKLPTEPELKLGLTRYAVDTGVADAYIITLPYTPSLTDGFNYFVKTINENTGACTINVNSTGIKSLHNTDGSELVAGTLRANGIAMFAYESVGDHYILISQNPEQAALASVSAAEAAASAAAALVSENNAATSETNAATSETNAATSETNAEAAYDSFDDRYLGPKASDPTLDNDGDALLAGALYWNTTDNPQKMYGYDLVNTQWDPVFVSGDADTLDLLDSTQFLRSDVADTHSGGLLSVGDFQVTGDFTSLGIDDNATAERVSVSDTSLGIGDSASASSYSLLRRVNNGDMIISGGTLGTTGAALTLFGGVHGSRANDWEINAAGNRMMFWDQSAGDLEILTGSGAKTSAVNFAADQVVEITTSMRFVERPDHVRTFPAATFGEFWVRNDVPNVPMFTDDAGTDHVLNAAGVSIGGSDTQFQYNNGGALGGIAALTYNDGATSTPMLDLGRSASLTTGDLLQITNAGNSRCIDMLMDATGAAGIVMRSTVASRTQPFLEIQQTNVTGTTDAVVISSNYSSGSAIDVDCAGQIGLNVDKSGAGFGAIVGRMSGTSTGAGIYGSADTTGSKAGNFQSSVASRTTPLVDMNQSSFTGGGLTTSPTLRINTNNAGPSIDLTNKGWIKFPATAILSTDANVLDDYQEGIATVAFTSTTGSITINTSWNSIAYTKIGRMVTFQGQVRVTSVSSPTGSLRLTGLPFTSEDLTEGAGDSACAIYVHNLASAIGGSIQAHVPEGQSYVAITEFDNTDNQDDLANHVQALSIFIVSGSYITSA